MRLLWLGFALLIIAFLAGPGRSAETGAQVRAAGRVGLTVIETAGIARLRVPVMVTGETVLQLTGRPAIDTRSLRLTPAGGQVVPLQVDEKDGTGLYQAAPNHTLDSDDEILWQVDLAPRAQRRYYLSYGPEALPDSPEDVGDVTVKENAPSGSHPYHLLLSNTHLQVGIQGNEAQVYDGRLKGCLARLGAEGTDLVTYGAPAMYGPTQAGVDWQRLPTLVARGPVRTTVAVAAEQVDRAFKREGGAWAITEPTKGTLKGKIYRYFSLYNTLPYLECREVYQVVKASRDFSVSFVFPFRTAHVSPLERGDTLYGPLEDGGIAALKLEDKKFYQTQYPFSGWLGLSSEKLGRGLALFFDYEQASLVYGGVIPAHFREHLGGKDTWITSNFSVTYSLPDMPAGQVTGTRFGLYALTRENGEAIRGLYLSLWGAPLDLTWGTPEQPEGGE